MSYINVAPAFSKDYKSQKDAKAAWEEGKDFVILDIMNPYYGKYINKQDAEGDPNIQAVNIRFNKHRGLAVVKIKHG